MANQRHSPETKSRALQRLADNFGDVALTASQMDIPERTIYSWKREYRQMQQLQQYRAAAVPDPDSSQNTAMPKPDTQQPLVQMHRKLLYHIHYLNETLFDDPMLASTRMQMLAGLMDRFIRLEGMVQAERRDVLRVEYVMPEGSISPVPDYLHPRNNEETAEAAITARKAAEAAGETWDLNAWLCQYFPEYGELASDLASHDNW